MRHIIVEGMDGTGKTGLITALMDDTRISAIFKLHERASSSIEGPVPALDKWTTHDVTTMDTQPQSIYDRHPVISEPIYGPICRGTMPGKFNRPAWLYLMTRTVSHNCVIIWCQPPWLDIHHNVYNGQHMAGVVDNAQNLYYAYRQRSASWRGVSIRYDYTRHDKNRVAERVLTIFGGPRGKG